MSDKASVRTHAETAAQRPCPICGFARTPGEDCAQCIRDIVNDKAGRLLDGCTMALQEFSTDDLLAIAELREQINPGGWMQKMIWQYIEVWR